MSSLLPKLSAPSVEQYPNGLGVSVPSPRLSWKFEDHDAAFEWQQTGYEIGILRGNADSEPTMYRVDSSESVLVPWPGRAMTSREHASVRVRAFGDASQGVTDWSPWTTVECALLHQSDWTARPITQNISSRVPGTDVPRRPLRFRRTFTPPAESIIRQRSRLYLTSLGVHRCWINGREVSDHVLSPGWTSYDHRHNFEVHDVAEFLTPSVKNVIAVEVAEGWYAGRLGFGGGRSCLYGTEIGPMVQLEIGDFGGRQSMTVVSDEQWLWKHSAIVSSGIYDGEVYDGRLEEHKWRTAEFEESSWLPVKALNFPRGIMITPQAPPVRVIESLAPKSFLLTPSGKTIADFGQNIAGRILVRKLHKPAGHVVTFTHAEVLDKGELGVRPLRIAKCRDSLISSGDIIHDWSPHYTFHGFRYVQIDGWTLDDNELPLSAESICAQVMHTDMASTGTFECSHPGVNKLHSNAEWSMRDNFLSIPTDCPQRDERLGWTGDIQVFTPAANFLYETAGMLSDWMCSVSAEQLADGQDGIVPFVVPNVVQETWPHIPQAVWDDVVVLTPWQLYRSFGDMEILQRQYPSMLAHVDKAIRRGDDGLWDPELCQLGDWLDPAAPPDQPGNGRTNGVLVADAYLVHLTKVLAQISDILGHKDDAKRFEDAAGKLKAAFQIKYVTPAGLVAGDSQTALSLVIMFDLLASKEQAATAGKRLEWLVRQAEFRVATGFAGTPIITHALTKSGHYQAAYRMLLEERCPSWLYPITMGATTIWERWDSMLPDGSINPGEMTSFNHYALGSVIDWLHAVVAGIRPLTPGWKTFIVAPMPGGNMRNAEVSFNSPYGRISCRWSITGDDQFELQLTVPPNSRALVILPQENHGDVAYIAAADPTSIDAQHMHRSGQYTFRQAWSSASNWPPKALTYPMPSRSEPAGVSAKPL
jgi:alpha-L-rhamnosidase